MNKILFFGNERLATGLTTTAPILRSLITAGYEITGVIVAQKQIKESRNVRNLEIVQVATYHNIPVLSPVNLSEAMDEIQAMQADLAVLVAYGKIVPKSIIDLFPHGIINIHPSLLPKHRGPTPIESVMLNGETETGVSLMQLAPKMDAGPVYKQQQLLVPKNVSKQELADQLQRLGADMLIKNLPAILSGSLKPKEQNDLDATYDQLLTKNESDLDFSKPAEQLERQVRAHAGWPRSRTKINKVEAIITRASVSPENGNPGSLWKKGKRLGIYCSEQSLEIISLIPVGKKEMSSGSFIAGYLK